MSLQKKKYDKLMSVMRKISKIQCKKSYRTLSDVSVVSQSVHVLVSCHNTTVFPVDSLLHYVFCFMSFFILHEMYRLIVT